VIERRRVKVPVSQRNVRQTPARREWLEADREVGRIFFSITRDIGEVGEGLSFNHKKIREVGEGVPDLPISL
jgi:hypothetical protein